MTISVIKIKDADKPVLYYICITYNTIRTRDNKKVVRVVNGSVLLITRKRWY